MQELDAQGQDESVVVRVELLQQLDDVGLQAQQQVLVVLVATGIIAS